jgi:CSLREA domain-containing protein
MSHPRVSTIELNLRKTSTVGSPLRTSAVLRAKTAGVCVAVLLSAVVAVATAQAETFTVTSTTDAVDATPGDGICATAAAECTLRAAVQEANWYGGPDVIALPAGTYPLSLLGRDDDTAAAGDLDVTDDLEIDGAGAGAGTTIIDGQYDDRVFDLGANGFFVGAVTIRDVTIQRGFIAFGSSWDGGGMAVVGVSACTVERVTLRDNSSPSGGAIMSILSGPLTITGSTFEGNTSLGAGGGLAISGEFTITNSTFSGNVANDVGGGGLSAEGTGTIRNVTFVDNEAPTGSAILNNAGNNEGTVTVVSSIIAGSAANHCGGIAVTSGGNNLDSDGSCAFAAAGDQNGVDPQLGPLADNGGPTMTHLPAAGSPVLDHGAAAGCPATDQRGEARPQDDDGDGTSVCDIGAVEGAAEPLEPPDLCPNDPAKDAPGICGCGVSDDDAMANGTPDCFVNGELEARIARAKAIIGALTSDQDPTEAELNEIGGSLEPYLTQFDGQVVLNGKKKKVLKLAKSASRAIAKVTKAKAGKKLDKAKKAALKALDKFDATIAPQA